MKEDNDPASNSERERERIISSPSLAIQPPDLLPCIVMTL
jgi:hypothetical protein